MKFALLAFSFFSVFVHAQSENINVSGRLEDFPAGSKLVKAEIRLETTANSLLCNKIVRGGDAVSSGLYRSSKKKKVEVPVKFNDAKKEFEINAQLDEGHCKWLSQDLTLWLSVTGEENLVPIFFEFTNNATVSFYPEGTVNSTSDLKKLNCEKKNSKILCAEEVSNAAYRGYNRVTAFLRKTSDGKIDIKDMDIQFHK